jgi:hypothetical protein
MEVTMVAALALNLDQALQAHQDTAQVLMDHPAPDMVQALQASRSPLAVTSKRLNGL